MHAQPFELILELLSPFTMRHPITLDGLLSAAIFNKTGLMGQDTIEHIPLVQENGIFKASSLCLPRTYRPAIVGRLMALRGEGDLSVGAFSPNNRGKRYSPVLQARGPYKNNMSAYRGFSAKEVSFFAVGDPDKVVELIQHYIPAIGKRSNAGAGEISSVSWLPSEDYSWIREDGMPARPLPAALWKKMGGEKDAPVAPLSVTLPYWETPLVEAVFPPPIQCRRRNGKTRARRLDECHYYNYSAAAGSASRCLPFILCA